MVPPGHPGNMFVEVKDAVGCVWMDDQHRGPTAVTYREGVDIQRSDRTPLHA